MNKVAQTLSEAISIKYNNIVYELKSQGKDVTVLSLGEAYFDIPDFGFSLSSPELYHYSHSRGILSLREKIAKYYKETYEVNVDPVSEVLVTAGSKIGVYYAMKALVNPEDEVLIIEPFWVSYSEQVKLVGGTPRFFPSNLKLDEIKNHITKKTKLLIINNPQNPTGKNFSKAELENLYTLAKDNSFYILSDEAYSDFLLNEKFVSFGAVDKKFERTIVVNSISKNFGMSGWRVGYMLSNKEIIYTCLKINQHMMTCAPTPLLMFIDKHFEDIIKVTRPQIEEIIVKRHRIQDCMDKLGIRYLEGSSTFYFFIDISDSEMGSVEFCDILLSEYFVATVPGIGYGESCDSYIRLSFGTESDERIISGLERIKELIEHKK